MLSLPHKNLARYLLRNFKQDNTYTHDRDNTMKTERFGIIPKNAKLLDFAPYYVTKDGKTVYSMITGKPMSQHLQKMTTGKPGYLQVFLRHHDGTSHWNKVHRLVAKCFVVNYKPSTHKEVGHKDNNKQNNNYTNLYWTDHKGNYEDAIKSGLNILGQKDRADGKPAPMKGKKQSASAKAKMAAAKIGVNHPKFKGWYTYGGLKYPSLSLLAKAMGTYPVKVHRMFERGEILFEAKDFVSVPGCIL